MVNVLNMVVNSKFIETNNSKMSQSRTARKEKLGFPNIRRFTPYIAFCLPPSRAKSSVILKKADGARCRRVMSAS